MFRNLFDRKFSPITLGLIVTTFTLQVLADPQGAPNNGSLNGGYNNGGSGSGGSTGYGGGTTGGSGMSSGSSTGYGGGSSGGTSGTSSGGSGSGGSGGNGMSSGSSTGYGGGSSSGSGSGGNSSGGSGGLSFGSNYGSAPSPCAGCGQANLGYGPNIGSGNTATGSNLGFSMGTAVSVGGTNTGTTNGNSTGSSSGSGSNGGYSLGTPVNSSSSIQTMVNSMLMGLGAVTGTTAVAQNFAAGLQRVATAIGSTVARVAETAARTIAVHAGASAAGYQGMVSSSVGAAKPGDVNYKQALDAAYYRGVKAYYDKHAIVSRIVPTGPMARIYGPVAVANSAALRAVDQKFNAGQISVVGAELGYTPAQIATAVGLNTYQTLTDYQRYGLLNSTVVTGDLTGTGLLDTDTLGQYDPSAGVIAVDTNDQDAAGVASTIQHEASHAADFAVKELVDRVMASTSSNIPQSLKDLAASIQEEVESRVAGSYYTGEIAQQYPVDYAGSIAHGTDSSPRAQRAHNYVEYAMEVTETIAYSVDPVQRQRWAEMTAMALGITQQEAAGLLNDLGYQHQQDEIDNFIDSSQGISQ